MAKMKGAIVVNTERCKGCRLCVEACPVGILELADKMVNRRGYRYVEQVKADACTGCTSCAVVCPDACITVYRKKID
ncbi:MAG: 4Fe-4S binding protein [Bacteroidaceae bacterium]|nr:4Fe-4S binding protein [Bacteroidaceae bacterium]